MPVRKHTDGCHIKDSGQMTDKEFIDTYIPLSGSLYKVAYYILESEQDAEDTVQDLYIKLWNLRDTLDAVYNPKAYCIRLLKNKCIDRIRQRSKETAELQEDILPDSTDISRVTEYKETVRRVTELIGTLPERQKKVMKMKVFENLSYDEISQKTGMSNLTLRVLLSQARSRIKKEL